jgi:hypothetical protein
MFENIKPGVFDRREKDRREKPLETCPLCQSTDVIDKKYSMECFNCGLYLVESEKTKKFGGYKTLWNERNGKIIPEDYI